MDIDIKKHYESIKDQITKFGDIKYTAQIIFIAIVLLMTWSGISAIQSNYNLQQQVSELKQQNQLSSLENSTISLQNEYYKSNQYLDLSARQDFGLARPGEKEIIVPDSVALSYTKSVPFQTSSTVKNKSSKNQINYQTWINFFLHRNNIN